MREHDPLETVYAFVERAYVRLQAGDLLFRCLDEHHLKPLQTWVESLVLAGPQNLGAIREILAEVDERQAQSDEDLQQVISNFESNLQSYGVRLNRMELPQTLSKLTAARFLRLIGKQGVSERVSQVACLELLRDTRDLMATLSSHASLLKEIETYLEDWLWGLVYVSAHQEQADASRFLVI
ncbi:MAG TPA: hypothetical protein VJ436_01675 [Anaerolineales bacterium]|nr:hypothetical protein [Anaerolineales bacterium]